MPLGDQDILCAETSLTPVENILVAASILG